jgi:putative spermidine/putrescine transport system substrate-binding protein
MSRTQIVWTSAAVVAAIAVASSYATARDLTVVGWGGASTAAQEIVFYKPFTAKTGDKLTVDTWSGGIGILRTKVKGGNANWDVVQAEVDEVILGCEEGLFEKIDWSKMGGRDKFIDAAYNDCGVGNLVFSQGLGYDGGRYPTGGPSSWADFWDVQKFPGKRGLRKTAKYTLEAALLASGVPGDQVYKVLRTPAGVDQAFKKLDELRPNIIWWSSPSQVPGLLASGEVVMSMGTAGRLLGANIQDGKNFKFVWSASMYAVDFYVVLKGTPNKDEAMQLVAFMSQADTQKLLPNYFAIGVTNKDAIKGVDPQKAVFTPTYPENMKGALALDAAFWVENGDQLSQRFNAWAAK